jgi:tubulin---tyrosine ligase
VDLYNVNIPMVDALRESEGSLPVVWTSIWRNSYGQLFQPHTVVRQTQTQTTADISSGKEVKEEGEAPAGGPDAQPPSGSNETTSQVQASERKLHSQDKLQDPVLTSIHTDSAPELVFKFAPSMTGLIGPDIQAPEGTDAWAVERGIASVSRSYLLIQMDCDVTNLSFGCR